MRRLRPTRPNVATYTSFRYTQRLGDLGITASVGSVADAYDNAMAETFVASLKRDLIGGRTFATRFEAEIAISNSSAGSTTAACTASSTTSRRPSSKPPTTPTTTL